MDSGSYSLSDVRWQRLSDSTGCLAVRELVSSSGPTCQLAMSLNKSPKSFWKVLAFTYLLKHFTRFPQAVSKAEIFLGFCC